ncbi:MAG TPA: TrkH family potassium uptake protein [Bacteroidales bacterium]|nr:TrkH family potassium uptake protein [Bacteroidales bacterium]
MKLINPFLIIRVLSTVLFIETIAFLTCLPVAFIYRESPDPFIWSAVFSLLLAAFFRFITSDADYKKFSNRDGYLVVSLAWIIFLLLGSLPYLLSNTLTSFPDAFFESSSGFTTTGSTVFMDVEILPHSILFWRSLTHWIGGLGFVTLVIIILPSLKITGFQIFTLESSLKEKIHPKTKSIVIRILYIYTGLTIMQIILLSLGDMNLFESICYSFATIATGGFATKNDSLISYSTYSQYIVMLFMFLAGVSQIVYYYLIKRNFRKVAQNEELWFYLGAVLIAGTAASSLLHVSFSVNPEESIRHGFFNTISIITTTGFSSADYLLWPVAGQILIFMLYFAGASTGSTTGSIKMARHLIIIKNIRSAFIKLNHPNVISGIKFSGKSVGERTNISILSFAVLYLFIFMLGTLVVTLTGPDVLTASSSVAASLGNIGPGLGTVGPLQNYFHLPDFTKIFLSLLMILGRLEIIMVLVIFTRTFWKV